MGKPSPSYLDETNRDVPSCSPKLDVADMLCLQSNFHIQAYGPKPRKVVVQSKCPEPLRTSARWSVLSHEFPRHGMVRTQLLTIATAINAIMSTE